MSLLTTLFVAGLLGAQMPASPVSDQLPSLRVSDDQRTFETSDGEPFLWLGDTAWELFHRLDREEALRYLDSRQEIGFTLVQAVVLAERDGLQTPNPYGDLPLDDLDPSRPNERYFEHVDFIVREANARGMYLGMLPTWGDKVTDASGGAGPVIFDEQNARAFGRFLGERYRDAGIIWILGGDRNIHGVEELAVWRAMAEGLREGDGGRHLMTYHPRGSASSASQAHNEPWLDFNSYQSGHSGRFNRDVLRLAAEARTVVPPKPFVDAEPAYEDIAVRFWEYMNWDGDQGGIVRDGILQKPEHFEQGFFDAHDVRVHAYWNLLSGAAGYTYGNNAIWQMHKPDTSPAIPALHFWDDALARPGADDMRHVRALFEQYPLRTLRPDQSLVFGPNNAGHDHVRAALGDGGRVSLLYLPNGEPVDVVVSKLAGERLEVTWFDPRDGTSTSSVVAKPPAGIERFSPPTTGDEQDWVLILAVPSG